MYPTFLHFCMYSLIRFIDDGGWDTLDAWLQDSKDGDNTPVLVEILKVYQQLPITVELLKKNSAAKTIKQFRKSEDESKNLKKIKTYLFGEE